MKKLWRLVALVLAICTVLPCLAHMPANAAETVLYSGTCGDNLIWQINDHQDLIISGNGSMYDYSPENPAPWLEYKRFYNFAIVNQGVITIGNYAFRGKHVGSLTVAGSVQRVGSYAMPESSTHMYFLGAQPDFATDAFADAHTILHYASDWRNVKENFCGGSISWDKGTLDLHKDTKIMYDQNQSLNPTDLVVHALFGKQSYAYNPTRVTFGAYDNSTTGMKSVEVTVDGITLTHNYQVTANEDPFANIHATLPSYTNFSKLGNKLAPTVTMGEVILTEGTHYTLTYQNVEQVGTATVIVTGIGAFAGYQETLTYEILRRDVSTDRSNLSRYKFTYNGDYQLPQGETPYLQVFVGEPAESLTLSTDYTQYYENNLNIGTATRRIIGQGNYYGTGEQPFQIRYSNGFGSPTLQGTYNGIATEELNSEIYFSDEIVSPGTYIGRVDSDTKKHIAYYELYKVINENLDTELVTTYESPYNYTGNTDFSYDFSADYDAGENSFTVYSLFYQWINSDLEVYTGMRMLYVLSKVADATAMVIENVPDNSDFRRDYYTIYAEDGNLGKPIWQSSDISVAAMDNGVLTLKKPGTTTLTATYGNLTATKQITVEALPFQDASILNTDGEIVYDHLLLEEDKDYTLSTTTNNGIITVIAEGKGLFEGIVSRKFDAATGQPLGDTKPGLPAIPGDINEDTAVNNEDVSLLLWHTLFPEDYPIDTDGDITGDGETNNEDVALLLWHTLFPEDYPL